MSKLSFRSRSTLARFRSLSQHSTWLGLIFPHSATVEIEAYFRSSSMRFPCGTVASIAVPLQHGTSEIDRGGAVRFRLLVIDANQTGRIIAAADGLRPARDRESPDRQPLLPLRETDLGDQLWKIDVDYRTGPTLLINGTIPGLASKLREQALLQGLVLPHALRMILLELGRGEADEEDDIWRKDWRTFLQALDVPVEPDDPDDPEFLEDWIEHAVDVFCAQKNFASRVKVDWSMCGRGACLTSFDASTIRGSRSFRDGSKTARRERYRRACSLTLSSPLHWHNPRSRRCRSSRTAMNLALFLVDLLSPYDPHLISYNRGLWSWLAAFFFE